MRIVSRLVYDESCTPNVVTYTNAELNDFLGQYDQISIQAVVDQAANSGYLYVYVEHSADGRNFVLKSKAIDGMGSGPGFGSFAAFVTTVLTGADQGISPSLGFVRLRVVADSFTPVHVKVHVTMRDQSSAQPAEPTAPVVINYGAQGAAIALEVRKKLGIA